MWSDWLVFCDCDFSLSALWCPLSAPTILLGFLLPWTWGISSGRSCAVQPPLLQTPTKVAYLWEAVMWNDFKDTNKNHRDDPLSSSKEEILCCVPKFHFLSTFELPLAITCKKLTLLALPVLVVKNLPANVGDSRHMGSIPGWGSSPGERNGNPLHYSCLGNPMDRGAWRAIVHRIQRGGHNSSDLACMTH